LGDAHGKTRLDQAPTGWKVIVVWGQPQQAMEVVGQDHDGLYDERMIAPGGMAEYLSQVGNVPHQEIVAASFGEIDRERICTTCNPRVCRFACRYFSWDSA
jgi:hypothetical protein